MMEAKKQAFKEPVLSQVNDESFKRRLEQRFSLDYKSVASSTIRHANTSQLESLVSTIEQEEYPMDSLLDSILHYANVMLAHIGYTNVLIESRSKRKIKKMKSQLQRQISLTDEQIVQADSTIISIDKYISKLSSKISDYKDNIKDKEKNLQKFKTEIDDYKDTTRNTLNPRTTMLLEQAELDFMMKEQELNDVKDAYDVSFTMVQEYYAQKSQDSSLRSVFEGNKIILNSLNDRLALELEKCATGHPIKILASNKSKITSAYKLQDDLLKKSNRYISLYNQKVSHLPTYKEMSQEQSSKRRALPTIKR